MNHFENTGNQQAKLNKDRIFEMKFNKFELNVPLETLEVISVDELLIEDFYNLMGLIINMNIMNIFRSYTNKNRNGW